MKYISLIVIILFCSFTCDSSYALGKIVDYFLENPNAWNDTKKITCNEVTRVVVTKGLKGIVFNLTDLTKGDQVALVFLESKKSVKLNKVGFYKISNELLPGKNRVVSVITRNYGNRTRFHYRFMLQRNHNDVPVKVYNYKRAILECNYDGNLPVKDISNLSGIKLCEIEVRSPKH